MTPPWRVTLVIFAINMIINGVTITTDNTNAVTFYLPDHARKPFETLHEVNSDDDEEDALIWDGLEGFTVDPSFDLDKATDSYDARNQVKTMFQGKISPTKSARQIQQTEPCYDKEDPLTLGLGLDDQLWDGARRKGRSWGRGGPST